jgi:hypothetical protein
MRVIFAGNKTRRYCATRLSTTTPSGMILPITVKLFIFSMNFYFIVHTNGI